MEEFIFDDDVDEVGAEVEAHCPKCKADTAHVVVSKYEDEIRRVQCNPCGDVHAFRKPRGEDEEPEPEATKKKKAVKAKPTWDQIMAKSKKQPKAYNIAEYFKELEILSHPKFGVGYVTDNIGDDKIEVTFQADKRVLIHNRKNLTLPFLRPLTPAGAKKGKAGKGAKAQAVQAAAAPAPPAPKAKVLPSAAARPAAKKPSPAPQPKPIAKPQKPAAKAKAQRPIAKKAPAHKKPVKATARAAAKKPTKAKPIKKVKKSR